LMLGHPQVFHLFVCNISVLIENNFVPLLFLVCIISFWIFSLILELIFSMLVIISVMSIFDMLVYMFSTSNEHILVSLLIYILLI
jgi:hypothetical protein